MPYRPIGQAPEKRYVMVFSSSFVLMPERFKSILDPDEKIIYFATQRRVGFGGALLEPKAIIVTDKRVIVVEKTEFGFRESYEVVPIANMLSVKIEHGIASNAIIVSLKLSTGITGLARRIDGLRYDDAIRIVNYLSKAVSAYMQESGKAAAAGARGAADYHASVICPSCGAKNEATAKYCWNCGAKL